MPQKETSAEMLEQTDIAMLAIGFLVLFAAGALLLNLFKRK